MNIATRLSDIGKGKGSDGPFGLNCTLLKTDSLNKSVVFTQQLVILSFVDDESYYIEAYLSFFSLENTKHVL